jgi:hypothetical protein
MRQRLGPSWLAASAAATCGFLTTVALAFLDIRPIEWTALGGAIVAACTSALLGRIKAVETTAALAFTFACILLEWPILALAYALIRYWITGQAIGQ